MTKLIDLAGRRFERLVVLSRTTHRGGARWRCRCDCGNEVVVRSTQLRLRGTRSCGCFTREVNADRHRTHGRYGTTEHSIGKGMKARCASPSQENWEHYGGRGIKVCERWRLSFEAFLTDMGVRPSGDHSIERNDVNGDYGPDNCRWATRAEQAANRRNSRIIEAFGERLTLSEWGRRYGVSLSAITRRIKKGWPTERAVSELPQHLSGVPTKGNSHEKLQHENGRRADRRAPAVARPN